MDAFLKKCRAQIMPRLPAVLIAAGIIIRVKEWLGNRSLWLDEAYLGLHLMGKSWAGILLNERWASDFPVPPMGFMLMEKINMAVFGNNELALRLFPLVCGIVSIFLFYALAKRLLPFRAMIFALAAFVFNDWLINYATELKQYSTDLMVVLALSLLILSKADKDWAIRPQDKHLFALSGMAAVTFSHVAVFVLATFGVCQQARLLAAGRIDDAKRGLFIGLFWASVFLYWYHSSISGMSVSPELIASVKEPGYMINVPTLSLEGAQWVGSKIWNVLSVVAGFRPFWGALCFAGLGAAVFFQQKKTVFILLVGPLAIAFLTGALGKYLLGDRFSLFMVPAITLCLAAGLDLLCGRSAKREGLVFWLCAILVLLPPFFSTIKYFWEGRSKEETRELIRKVQADFRKDDLLMVNDSGSIAMWYYFGQNGRFWIPKMVFVSDQTLEDGGEEKILLSLETPKSKRGYCCGYDENGKKARTLGLGDDLDVGRPQRTWFLGGHLKGVQDFVLEYFRRRGMAPEIYEQRPGAALMMFDVEK